MKKNILLALLAIFTITPVMSFASNWGNFKTITNQTFFAKKYKGVKAIHIKQVVLDVRINPSSDENVFAKAHVVSMETNAENFRISERLIGSTLEIYQEPTKGGSSYRKSEGYIEVNIPEELKSIVVISTSGDLSIKGVSADKIESKSVSGDVMIVNSKANSFLSQSTSGDVYTEKITANTLSCSSVSGDVKIINSQIKQSISCSSTSGDCYVDNSSSGSVSTRSVSGDCAVKNTYVTSLSSKSTSGSITAMLLGDVKNIEFSSVSGDADIFLKNDLRSYGYSFSSTSGEIKVQGLFTARRSYNSPSSNGSMIQGKTTSGDILIRKF